MRKLRAIQILAFALVFQIDVPLMAQEVVWSIVGAKKDERLGWIVFGLDDLNRDGVDDVGVVGFFDPCGGSDLFVRTCSGVNGAEIYTICCSGVASTAGIDDLDGDGVGEILIGNRADDRGGLGAGAALVYSGATGVFFREHLGSTGDDLGYGATRITDLDADGTDEYAVGALQGSGPGYAAVYSGKTGSLLHLLLPTGASATFCTRIADAGDINSDGFTDLLVNDRNGGPGFDAPGSVWVFSGLDGSVIRRHDGEFKGVFGDEVDGLGEVDGDGFPDYVISDPETDGGYVYVYSGKAGNLLYRQEGGVGNLGWQVSRAGDVNHDGAADFLASNPSINEGPPADCGGVFLWSGKTGSLLYHWTRYRKDSQYGCRLGSSLRGGIDLDHDGSFEVIAGDEADESHGLHTGAAFVYRTRDYWLDTTPQFVYGGEHFSMQVAESNPGSPVGIWVTAFDDTPLFWFVNIGFCDATGSFRPGDIYGVPRSYEGHTLTLRAYLFGRDGKITATNDQVLGMESL